MCAVVPLVTNTYHNLMQSNSQEDHPTEQISHVLEKRFLKSEYLEIAHLPYDDA
jgi:hypothetical protein